MAAQFKIFKGSDDKFYWNFTAANGEIVCHSQGYTTKDAAKTGVQALKDDASGAGTTDQA